MWIGIEGLEGFAFAAPYGNLDAIRSGGKGRT